MKGKMIILYSADKHNLERKGKWLTTHLMRILPVVENIPNHKKAQFTKDIDQEYFKNLDNGIWVVVEDYSIFHGINIDNSLVGDIEILLDGNKETQLEEARLTLLELAAEKKWHVVGTDQNPGAIRQHILDCIQPLLKTPGGIYPGVFV